MRPLATTFLFSCAIIALAAITLINWWLAGRARTRIFREVIAAPANNVGLVLGTSDATHDGKANLFFTGRMETAARLYDAGKVRHFLLSGNGSAGAEEPAAMREALLAAGVPDRALSLDNAGFRTLDSMARARKVYDLSRLTIITDDFHAARALFLARQLGLDAIAVTSREVPLKTSLRTRGREVLARVKAVLDVYALHVQPRVLGPKTPIDVRSQDFKTIDDRVSEFGDAVHTRMAPFFEAAHVGYPPARLALLAFKQERVLQLYASDSGGDYRFIRSFQILAASGVAGPKLREGDRQVPEGIYALELLNPNSRYHLSLRVDYPNEFDREHAEREGRTEPGTDIMIHGGERSTGCIAVGDEAAEDLFVTAALARDVHVPIIIAPVDFRVQSYPTPPGAPPWLEEVYRQTRKVLSRFPPAH